MKSKKKVEELKLAIMEEIVEITEEQMDMEEFGINVAGILKYNKVIDEDIYNALLG